MCEEPRCRKTGDLVAKMHEYYKQESCMNTTCTHMHLGKYPVLFYITYYMTISKDITKTVCFSPKEPYIYTL